MALTLRQKALKILYPLFIWASKKTTKIQQLNNKKMINSPVSFYTLSATLNDGKELSFEKLKGKKVLIVNTASDCGYTPQYAELQKLYENAKEEVEIIAFPANDFKEQEKGTDQDIAAFCSRNYGVTFPLAKKSVVVKGNEQHPVFQWLTNKSLNGWNDKEPSWNFSKFLINEEGVLAAYFEPSVSPLSTDVTTAVHS